MTSNSKQALFVGSYASADAPSIYGCLFDSASGELIIESSFTGIANPSFLTVHPNGRFLYSVSETGLGSDGVHGSVWAFRLQPDSLTLEPINQQSTQGDWPCHVEIDGRGQWLIACNYGTGNAALYPLLADGSLGEMQALVQHSGSGPNTARQEGPHAHSAVFTPDNRFVIVADLGIDQLVVYKFDAETGSLTHHAAVPTNPGAGPRHFAFAANGRFLYVANELDSTVTVYSYQPENGTLHAQQTLSTLPAADPTNSVADIHLSATGQHLYVSNRGHNSVAVFEVGENGRLTPLGTPSCGGNWPRHFGVGENGRFLLVANRRSNAIAILPVAADSVGVGTAVNQVSLSQPSCIKFLKHERIS